jgi:hypothetical protein
MQLDYATLEALRQNHPAWRLLRADHAPLVAAFLHRVFILPNERVLPQSVLLEKLDDELFAQNSVLGQNAFPKPAQEYLNEWANHGWLRKFYGRDSDEPQFDLTAATEKAVAWLASLTERSFVGTESRLLLLFDLLRQMDEGSEQDPQRRLAQLKQSRAEIDAEIARVEQGQISVMDGTALKDRFLQFNQLARELLADFREVESNFRALDRRLREQIALWNGAKGALLQQIMGERDAIADSDQGKSFHAFWDFLMSSQRQDQLSGLLTRVLALAPVAELKPDARIKRVHYDWLEAGEHTQRTVAQLSQQLRRFLDDQAWLENRRIMDILHSIETRALALRAAPPPGSITDILQPQAEIDLPLERPLYAPAIKPVLAEVDLQGDAGLTLDDQDMAALYAQMVVDKAQLAHHIRHCLHRQDKISLAELCQQQALQHGLAELVTYLHMATDGSFKSSIDEEQIETIEWQVATADGSSVTRQAHLPRVVFFQ